jgi:hypothetical protein
MIEFLKMADITSAPPAGCETMYSQSRRKCGIRSGAVSAKTRRAGHQLAGLGPGHSTEFVPASGPSGMGRPLVP